MPKQKTHKGILKRVKVTPTGKVKFKKAGRGHLLAHKTANRKRRLRRAGVLHASEAPKVKRLALGQR